MCYVTLHSNERIATSECDVPADLLGGQSMAAEPSSSTSTCKNIGGTRNRETLFSLQMMTC